MKAGIASTSGILCAIHCALAPVLVPVIPLLAFAEVLEWGLLLVGMIYVAYMKMDIHRLSFIGLAVWGFSLLGVFPLPEVLTTTVGSAMFALGVIFKGRECKEHEGASHVFCVHE